MRPEDDRRSPGTPPADAPPAYTRYRARPRFLSRREQDLRALRTTPSGPGTPRTRRPLTWGRALRGVLGAALAWVALSALLFLVSAQIEAGKVSGAAERALDPGGYPLFSATNVLVLGSDARTARTREPGAQIGGPSRSDTILLMRVGGGRSARLSIPRDTVVDIPGHGPDKINAAYAIGGPALAIETVKRYLGIEINHVVEVSFDNFPDLVDALGGIDYSGGCVISRINGGFRNGGYTLRLRRGTHRLDGRQALALARTRKNDCNARENDLTRARRQQKIFAAIRARVTSPATFARLPWVSWTAPKAIRSDMAGPSLIGLFAALATSGTPPTRVLRPSGAVTTAGGGAGLTVSEEERRAAVRRFLRG